MRKLPALAMVVLLGVVLLAVAGCGSGDTKTAQEALKTAEAAYNNMNNNITQIQGALVPILGGVLVGEFSNVTAQNLQTADANIKSLVQQAPQVSALYAKVDALKGVEDYKAYADAMQKVITMSEQLLDQGATAIQALLPLVGNITAIQQYFQANPNFLPQLQEASNSIIKAYNDAQQIKKDKNLTW